MDLQNANENSENKRAEAEHKIAQRNKQELAYLQHWKLMTK